MVQILAPKLEKRIKWITSCASVSAFDLVVFDDWKTRKFRIFIRVSSYREFVEKEGQMVWETKTFGTETKREYYDPTNPLVYRLIEVPIYHCYYLGQYPWIWDHRYYVPAPPAGSWLTWEIPLEVSNLILAAPTYEYPGYRFMPMTGAPSIPMVEGVTLEGLTEDEIIFFHGKQANLNYQVQKAFYNWINNRLKNCIAQMYPPPERKGKRTIQTPKGPAEWPGKDIRKLDLPRPEPPPIMPALIPAIKISLKTTLSISSAERLDGLTLETVLE